MADVTKSRWSWAAGGGVLGALVGVFIGNWINVAAMFENVTGSKSISSWYEKVVTCANRPFCYEGVAFEVRLRLADTTDAPLSEPIARVFLAPGTTCAALAEKTWPLNWDGGYSQYDSYVVSEAAEIGKKVPANQGTVQWAAKGLAVNFNRTDRGYLTFNCI